MKANTNTRFSTASFFVCHNFLLFLQYVALCRFLRVSSSFVCMQHLRAVHTLDHKCAPELQSWENGVTHKFADTYSIVDRLAWLGRTDVRTVVVALFILLLLFLLHLFIFIVETESIERTHSVLYWRHRFSRLFNFTYSLFCCSLRRSFVPLFTFFYYCSLLPHRFIRFVLRSVHILKTLRNIGKGVHFARSSRTKL